MTFILKPLFLLLLISFNLHGNNLVFNDISEYKINKTKLIYKIEAKTKKIDYKKLKKFMFFNKRSLVSNSSYYLEGKFLTKDLNINFKKAYFLEGNFIMHDLKGVFKKKSFKAKSAKYTRDNLELKSIFITLEGKKYRKIKYVMSLK